MILPSASYYDHHHQYLSFLTLNRFTVLDFLSKDLTSAFFSIDEKTELCGQLLKFW